MTQEYFSESEVCQTCGACCQWTHYEFGFCEAAIPDYEMHPVLRGEFHSMIVRYNNDQYGEDELIPCAWFWRHPTQQRCRCNHYDDRPPMCRDFLFAEEHCVTARTTVGIEPHVPPQP